MENNCQCFLPTKIVCKILNVCPRTLQRCCRICKEKFLCITPKRYAQFFIRKICLFFYSIELNFICPVISMMGHFCIHKLAKNTRKTEETICKRKFLFFSIHFLGTCLHILHLYRKTS